MQDKFYTIEKSMEIIEMCDVNEETYNAVYTATFDTSFNLSLDELKNAQESGKLTHYIVSEKAEMKAQEDAFCRQF